MPLVSSDVLLRRAQCNGYAVGAFNVENMEMAQAAIRAATELRAPLILQLSPATIAYASLEIYAAMMKTMAYHAPIPIALHLDHEDSFELCILAMQVGFPSVMIDGSHAPFADNVAMAARVVEVARPFGCSVEAKLGRARGTAKDLEGVIGYTDPQQAMEFVERTGINSLAVDIGTANGVYANRPDLDFALLEEIQQLVSIPLVLHGASGLSEGQVQGCIERGVAKVIFGTELRIAYTHGIKDHMTTDPSCYDPKDYCAAGREAVAAIVKSRIHVCGCAGQAELAATPPMGVAP